MYKWFILDRNTWNPRQLQLLETIYWGKTNDSCQIEIVIWNHITVNRLLVLNWKTENYLYLIGILKIKELWANH